MGCNKNYFVTMGVTLLTISLIPYSNGLRCYTCAHFEAGSLVGYNVSASCQWGLKPDDKYLEECLGDGEDNGKFDFTCAETKINGSIQGPQGPEDFIGTLRGCATDFKQTIKDTFVQIPGHGTVFQENKRCRQGKLSAVVDDFKGLAGHNHLENWVAIFSTSSNVKFCTCTESRCWESSQELPEAGAGGGGGSSAEIKVFVLISSLLTAFTKLSIF